MIAAAEPEEENKGYGITGNSIRDQDLGLACRGRRGPSSVPQLPLSPTVLFAAKAFTESTAAVATLFRRREGHGSVVCEVEGHGLVVCEGESHGLVVNGESHGSVVSEGESHGLVV
eukprot:g61268.t1